MALCLPIAATSVVNRAPFRPPAEHHPLLSGATVKAACSLPASGVMSRMLVFVVAVQRAYNGEFLVRLKDPSGTVTGTLTSDVLEHDPDVRRGSVLLLQKVAVLRTPPPGALHHLCITPDNVAQVIPASTRAAPPPISVLPAPAYPLQRVAEPPPLPQQQLPAPLPASLAPSNGTQQVLGDSRNVAGFGLSQQAAKSQGGRPGGNVHRIDNGIDELLADLDEEFAL